MFSEVEKSERLAKAKPIRMFIANIANLSGDQQISVRPEEFGEEALLAFTLSTKDLRSYVFEEEDKPCGKVILRPKDVITGSDGIQHVGVLYAKGSKAEVLATDGCSMQRDLPEPLRFTQQEQYQLALESLNR